MTLSLTRPKPKGEEPRHSGLFIIVDNETVLYATDEQSAIVEAALASGDNILINALAGAAKTSTLQFLAKYLPPIPTLCLAFNKRIAEEMESRLPGHVTSRTMNSIGHRVWATAVGHKLVLDTKKSHSILTGLVKDLPSDDRRAAYDSFGDTLRLISFSKRAGYIPDGKYPHAKRLATKDDVHDYLDEPPTSLQLHLVDATLCASIQLAYAGTIDFDDQIFMPTLFGGTFPRFPLVMVDEAQDLSEINHAMLRKLATERLIAVGDPWQSIYGFRGAKLGGMAALSDHFHCREYPLSVSFRCPQAIVEHVRSHVPHMKWRKPHGKVNALESLNATDIPDGSAVICRNNAPLFRLALSLLAAGRGVHLVGTDLGPSLVKTLRKLGPEGMTNDQVLAAINAWETDRLARSKAKAAIADKADCLRVFASFGSTLGGAISYCEHLFAGRGAIQLLSGHKAKGLEWEVVFHLDPWRIPSPWAHEREAIEQEENLRYVIATRAKSELNLIDLESIVT